MYQLYRKLRRRIGPRRFHAFAIGPGKSGTTSLAAMFNRDFRAAHEPGARQLIELLLQHADSAARERSLIDFLNRQEKLRLEMNASSLNTCIVDVLAREFPDARFILSVRDCLTWTNSAINQLLNNPSPSAHFAKWRVAEFGDRDKLEYATEEQPLHARDLWPLASYLSLWQRYYQLVLDSVPAQRLLVLRMLELEGSAARIAEFLDIDAESLDTTRAHSHSTVRDHGVLASLDPDFVNKQMTDICGPLMQRWFPDEPLDVGYYLDNGG